MKPKIPVYKMSIDDNDTETGVSYVAFVDKPATERTWQAFSEQKIEQFKFKATEPDKQIVSGPLMVADLPIYRNDARPNGRGEHYVYFEASAIQKIVEKYFRNQFTSNVNLMHEDNMKIKGAFMIESYMIDRKSGKLPPNGFDGLTDGSWFGSYKVEDKALWDNFIKTGDFTGFSVEGEFIMSEMEDKPLSAIDDIIKIIDGIKAQ